MAICKPDEVQPAYQLRQLIAAFPIQVRWKASQLDSTLESAYCIDAPELIPTGSCICVGKGSSDYVANGMMRP